MSLPNKIKDFIVQCERALKKASKPARDEFLKISGICLLGLTLLGVIGLTIRLIANLLSGSPV